MKQVAMFYTKIQELVFSASAADLSHKEEKPFQAD
jgi:hypothetical protein